MRPRLAAPAWVQAAEPTLGAVTVLGELEGVPHVVLGRDARGTPLVLKRYVDATGHHAARAMRSIGRDLASRGPDVVLAVPTVRRWRPSLGVLVQSAAPGPSVLASLDTPHRRRVLTAVARALADLHRSAARPGRVTSMADHVADLIHPHPAVVARAVPELGGRIRQLTTALVGWTPATPVPAVPIHRDAHARQMTLDQGRVWLVDWDDAARGDAALDVANFALYLRTHVTDHAEAAADHFVDAYLAAGPAVADRLDAHTACMALRLACKTWRRRGPHWRRRMAAFVSLAERTS